MTAVTSPLMSPAMFVYADMVFDCGRLCEISWVCSQAVESVFLNSLLVRHQYLVMIKTENNKELLFS